MSNFFGFFIIVGGFIGWLLNIVQLAQADHFTGMVMVRALGVLVAPLGAIIGWF